MRLLNDELLDIATGAGANSRVWNNKKILWSDLVDRLTTAVRTGETLKEFLAASKDDQQRIKDVGGFVGGYLRAGRRKPTNVVHRQILTLDLDFANMELWDDFTMLYDNACVLHGTHKHSVESPRFRLIMPLSREVSSDEYQAIGRKVAGMLGIDLFDRTTFQPSRLMFWPSVPKDVELYYKVQDGVFLDADEVLASYADWRDSSLWPTSEVEEKAPREAAKKQEAPELKGGIVGAFCRTYDVVAAIEELLSDVYTLCEDGRYTYVNGSTAKGLIIYDDKFAYSHHGTDPASGKLCNAFDLVRIHKFGHLDNGKEHEEGKAASYKAMCDFAAADATVRKTLASDRLANAAYDFCEADSEEGAEDEDESGQTVVDSLEWAAKLAVDGRGKYLSSAGNINEILRSDPALKGMFRYNQFDAKNYITKKAPWRPIKKEETIRNVDLSGLRNYLECVYEITGSTKIDDALALELERNAFHPVRNYLTGLKWDGVKRLEKLLPSYFGVADNAYTRAAMRKMLVGAVARIFEPGKKFDYVLVLVGEQGVKKSTFFRKLGKNWFSDSFQTVNGKEAFEQLQGAWIMEIAELSALRKSEVEAVKHFITKQEDSFRPAYGRTVETYPRQCVFFGSTNRTDFLNDPTGNRRFLPVDINEKAITKDAAVDLDEEVDQVWAEAVALYKNGETLYLSQEEATLARAEQDKHSETDERKGVIEAFIAKKLPDDWDNRSISERNVWASDELSAEGTEPRKVVCVAEIWCECLGQKKDAMDRYKTREINDIMRTLPDWRVSNSTKNFKHYGKQKFYYKIEQNEDI